MISNQRTDCNFRARRDAKVRIAKREAGRGRYLSTITTLGLTAAVFR